MLKKHKEKIKKQDELTIKLEKNIDILNYVSTHNSMRPKLVVGFAAETNNLEENAISKLKNKNCDIIIANDVSNKDIGFDSDINEVTIYYNNNKKEKLSAQSKSSISEEIVNRLINYIN
ncbi:phosphopantothenoylcysteine decarboxylase [Candidatus Pelagibacter sp.]|nr:phosphopantothenoylcysteine decarboxylase [Candidatus Pelagibacter sp.]